MNSTERKKMKVAEKKTVLGYVCNFSNEISQWGLTLNKNQWYLSIY